MALSPKFPLRWWGIKSTLSGHISLTSHQSRTAAGERLWGVRVKVFKSAGLRRSGTVGLHPHWCKQNYDAVWAGATFAAVTTDVTCGAINAEPDSLNPIAALSPMVGMWLNCIFGGKGVGMINLLLFLVVRGFVADQMVGRTPEYLGKKIGARR
jgi:hypothetical protein